MTILLAFGLGIIVAWLPSLVIVLLLARHALCVGGDDLVGERPSGPMLRLIRGGADAK
jgi:hypothetical protein